MTQRPRLTRAPRWLFAVPLIAVVAVTVLVPPSLGRGLVRGILYLALVVTTIPLARDLVRGIKEADPTLGKTPAQIRAMRDDDTRDADGR